MEKDALGKAYQKEIAYQTRMLRNIHSWSSLVLLLSTVDVLLLYYLSSIHWLKPILIFFLLSKVIILLLLGRVIYKGTKNLDRVKRDMEEKLNFPKG